MNWLEIMGVIFCSILAIFGMVALIVVMAALSPRGRAIWEEKEKEK